MRFFAAGSRERMRLPAQKRRGGPEGPPPLSVEISRILCRLAPVVTISLWAAVADGLEARDPSRARGPRVPVSRRGTACACTRWGFPCPQRRRWSGALLPHLFTLATRPRGPFGGSFSVALSRAFSSAGGHSPSSSPCRVRTFLAPDHSGGRSPIHVRTLRRGPTRLGGAAVEFGDFAQAQAEMPVTFTSSVVWRWPSVRR